MKAEAPWPGPLALVACLLLGACATPPLREHRDAPPPHRADIAATPDAVPREEAPSRGGNASPYTVFGKTYRVMDSAEGYHERGIASWYGKKFHGRLTANGEVYDAYAMSAAHRSLPLPTYVRVTNLDNGRKVIVRVNDRGPFHAGRLIDLSYAAAYKLGFHNIGTARVEIEALNAAPPAPAPAAASQAKAETAKSSGVVLQAGAFRSLAAAEKLRAALVIVLDQTVTIHGPGDAADPWYRVRIGPLEPEVDIGLLQQRVSEARLGVPRLVSGS